MQVSTEVGKKELIPVQQGGIVGLAVPVEELKKRYDDYQKLRKMLLTPKDYYKIKTKSGEEIEAIRKSGWYTFSTAFNLSLQILEEVEVDDPTRDLLRYKFIVRCIAPNGKFVDAAGSCDNQEKNADGKSPKWPTAHIIRAMADTRAKERAIIAALGVPETAAEEFHEFEPDVPTNTVTTNGVCHCKFEDMKPNKGIDEHCGKPLTKGQYDTLVKMGKVKS